MNGTLNKVILIGNLGKDVDIHYFDNGQAIARFPLATTESFIDRHTGDRIERTEWHNIVARNKLAEICHKYLRKGDKVYVEGKIKSREFTGNDGNKRYYTEIHAMQMTFLTPPRRNEMPATDTQSGINPEENTINPAEPADNPDTDLPF